MDELASIAKIIKENDDILIIAHVSPDGDTLGSALALARMLAKAGKRIQIVCEDRVPDIYRFMPGAADVLLPENAKKARAAVAVDCADAGRLGAALPLFRAAEVTCSIDHHFTNTEYAGLNYVNGNTAATGELIFALLSELGAEPDREAAACLYTAIMSDTGNFAYSNTTPATLRVAARLMELGADNVEINRLVYRTIPFHKQKLLGVALTKLTLHENGRVGLSMLSQKEIDACGASEEDTEGIIDHIRDIRDVEIALMVREANHNACKISLRSKLYADVGAIAKRMGGGGHLHAAGYTAGGVTLEEAAREALSMAADAVRI